MIKAKVLKCRNFISQKGNACTFVTVILSNNEVIQIFVAGTVEYSSGTELTLEVISGQNLNPQLRIVK